MWWEGAELVYGRRNRSYSLPGLPLPFSPFILMSQTFLLGSFPSSWTATLRSFLNGILSVLNSLRFDFVFVPLLWISSFHSPSWKIVSLDVRSSVDSYFLSAHENLSQCLLRLIGAVEKLSFLFSWLLWRWSLYLCVLRFHYHGPGEGFFLPFLIGVHWDSWVCGWLDAFQSFSALKIAQTNSGIPAGVSFSLPRELRPYVMHPSLHVFTSSSSFPTYSNMSIGLLSNIKW